MSKIYKNILLLFLLISGLIHISAFPAFSETDEENNIRIYKKRGIGVVNILTIVVNYDFFLNPIPREGASGSGAIIDKKGHILTNNHVVKDAERLFVTLMDGSKWEAEIVGTDPKTDLAVIRIDAPPGLLSPIPYGNSKNLQVGNKVLAIGNPFGLDRTMTTGIISSLGRVIKNESGLEMEDIIQTDASINPGNSGGPLLNSNGYMIGINTAIFSPSGGSVGIGFAIPINTAKRVVKELIEKGYVSYPFLGVELEDFTQAIAQALSFPVSSGVMIARVYRKGPADVAGLRGGDRRVLLGNTMLIIGGDIIVSADRNNIDNFSDFRRFLNKHKPGDTITLTIYRNNRKRRVKVVLGEEKH